MRKENLDFLCKKFEKEMRYYARGKENPYKTSDFAASKLEKLGLRTEVLKNFEPDFGRLTKEEEFELSCYIFQHSRISEAKSWCLGKIGKYQESFLFERRKALFFLTSEIENWWHSDSLSSIYARILEEELAKKDSTQSEVLKKLEKWNKSLNLWERRQSVVSLFYYASQRKKKILPVQIVINLINNLLQDEEYYVQKGVGWALRETYQVYPEEIKIFLLKKARILSAVSWQAATEKLEKDFKKKLKEVRKS